MIRDKYYGLRLRQRPNRYCSPSRVKLLSDCSSCHHARPCTIALTKVRSTAGAAALPLGVISLITPPRRFSRAATVSVGASAILLPGDLIFTGTPARISAVVPGDEIAAAAVRRGSDQSRMQQGPHGRRAQPRGRPALRPRLVVLERTGRLQTAARRCRLRSRYDGRSRRPGQRLLLGILLRGRPACCSRIGQPLSRPHHRAPPHREQPQHCPGRVADERIARPLAAGPDHAHWDDMLCCEGDFEDGNRGKLH